MEKETEIIEVNGEKCLIQVVGKDVAKVLDTLSSSGASIVASGELQYDEEKTEAGIDVSVGKKSIKIAPWGMNNDFPSVLGSLVYQSTIVPALNNFNANQIWGKGPVLVDEFTETPVKDKEIWAWLKTWNYRKFLLQQLADYVFSENCFSGMILSKGTSLGLNVPLKVTSLYHLHNKDARLELMDKSGNINSLVCGSFPESKNSSNDSPYSLFPLYSFEKKIETYKKPILGFHSKRETANYPYYVYPQYTSVLETWLPIATKIAQFHKAMLENSINAKWHIQISSQYVEELIKEKKMANPGETHKITFTSVYEDIKKTAVELMSSVMSGAENSGKFFVSPMGFNEMTGNEYDYIKITALDSKLKETSESHLKLYEQVISSITSAESVDTSLASVVSGSKMNSGSEMLNSHNIHQQVKTNIPREVICASINEAIRINFPEKDIKMTFKSIFLVAQQEDKSGVLKEEGGSDGK